MDLRRPLQTYSKSSLRTIELHYPERVIDRPYWDIKVMMTCLNCVDDSMCEIYLMRPGCSLEVLPLICIQMCCCFTTISSTSYTKWISEMLNIFKK